MSLNSCPPSFKIVKLGNPDAERDSINAALQAIVRCMASSSLPSQAGHAGQYLTTDGTNVSWAAIAAGQVGIQYKDEGTNLGTSGTVDEIDFTGAGVSASRAGNKITVNVTGASGGQVDSVVAGDGVDVDSTDPVNPEVSAKISADANNAATFGSDSGLYVPDTADLSITGGVDYADASTSLAADSTWYATGAQVVLDEGGYLVTMFAHGYIETSAAGRAGVITRLYNVTDSAAVANSETLIVEDDNTCNKEGGGSSVAYVEIGASKTLRLEASRIASALYVSAPTVLSNTEGRSGISYIRISSLTTTNHILTESGDKLATESGDILRIE